MGHDCLMHISGNELTADSSVVAALAIVGGYLGVHAANGNALKIAREECSSRQKSQLDELKRITYVRLLVALGGLATANMEQAALQTGASIPRRLPAGRDQKAPRSNAGRSQLHDRTQPGF
jgi:hypothetical protein